MLLGTGKGIIIRNRVACHVEVSNYNIRVLNELASVRPPVLTLRSILAALEFDINISVVQYISLVETEYGCTAGSLLIAAITIFNS